MYYLTVSSSPVRIGRRPSSLPDPNSPGPGIPRLRCVESDRRVAATFSAGAIELALGVSIELADLYDQIESTFP
jgi:hypothetical protein